MKIVAGLLVASAAVVWALSGRISRSEATGDAPLVSAAADAEAGALPIPGDSLRVITRRVWAGPDVDLSGAVSPDGRFVVYTDWTTGDLAIRELASGQSRRLTNKGSWLDNAVEYALGAALSPDGSRIVYGWATVNGWELRMIEAEGSAPRTLYANREFEYVAPAQWSPDGRFVLAVAARMDKTNQIMLIGVHKGETRVLRTLDWRSPGKLNFSPDGRYIVYDFPQSDGARERDVFALSVDGSREARLVQDPADDFVLGWAPDRGRILFASNRGGTMSGYMLRVAGLAPQGMPELVKADVWNIEPVGFTAAGAYYYGVAAVAPVIYVATLDVTTGMVVTPPTRAVEPTAGVPSGTAPEWSPDGRHLVYVSRPGRGAPPALVVRDVETGQERAVSPGLIQVLWPTWSPDGLSVLVVGTDQKRRSGLYAIDLQTGQVTAVVRNEPGFWVQFPAWSRDGKGVFFQRVGAEGKAPDGIIARDLATGRERELYSGGMLPGTDQPRVGIGSAVSPDGEWLVLAANVGGSEKVRSALMVIPASGGSARELVRAGDGQELRPVAWTRAGIVYAVRYYTPGVARRPPELWRVAPEGGLPVKLPLVIEAPVPGTERFRFDPDGRRVAFGADNWTRELWVMENFLSTTPSTSGDAKGGRR